jgi:ketol-acid reductoisomerase
VAVRLTVISQYGQLKGSFEVDTTALKKEFSRVAHDRILNGAFAKEFMALDTDGPGVQKELDDLYKKANETELAVGEARVRERLGLKTI